MKNFFLIIAIGSLVLSVSSCCKPVIDFKTILKNTTDKEIELRYFNEAGMESDFIKEKSELKEIFRAPNMFVDSILVFSNGILHEIHYSRIIKKIVSNTKVVPYENARNLLNENNYQISREEYGKCNSSLTTYVYSF